MKPYQESSKGRLTFVNNRLRGSSPLRKFLVRTIWRALDHLLDAWQLALDSLGPAPISADSSGAQVRILFVCYGNICRSPMAEGILRQLLALRGLLGQITVDSAGTGVQNVGKRPHWRARACARKRGVNISDLRARQFSSNDFERFDYILVMDQTNLSDVMRSRRGEEGRKKVSMLLDHVPDAKSREISDPVGKGTKHFEEVYDLIERGCLGLLEEIASVQREASKSSPCH